MTAQDLISEIEECAERLGVAPSTVTSRGVQNSRLYRSLKAGGDCTHRTAARLRDYMAEKLRDQRVASSAPETGRGG